LALLTLGACGGGDGGEAATVLDELPPGRTPILTYWANGPLDELAVWSDVRKEASEGRQSYVV
jgi:ATP-dependent DNA helicase RecG